MLVLPEAHVLCYHFAPQPSCLSRPESNTELLDGTRARGFA
jgi:hypothetical protein